MADISNITVSVEGVNTVCEIKDKVARNGIAINRTTLGTQCKNLLKNTAKSTSYSDVKFTVNSDGTVDVSSIKTSTATRFLVIGTLTLEAGNYVLTGADDLAGYGDIRVYVDSDVYQYNTPFTITESKTVVVRICVYTNRTLPNTIRVYPMLRYADITDSTYESYKPSLLEQINNFGTQQQLLCDYSSAATSSATIQITGLFSNYSAVICIVKYSYGTINTTLPLKYIKSIGTSKEYSPVSDLNFQYVDDDNLFIGGADAAISNVKIISLY